MADREHKEIASANTHAALRTTFADKAARDADATSYVAGEQTIFSLTTDRTSLHYLSNHSPTTWATLVKGIRDDATTDPGVSDDIDAGYEVGSVWVNVTSDTFFICVDSSAGAAVWAAGGASTMQAAYNGGASTTVVAGTPFSWALDAIGDAAPDDNDVTLLSANSTAAAAAAQQRSPMHVLEGQGWKTNATAASQEVQFGWQVIPVQGAANPTGALHWFSNINDAGFTERMYLDSTGSLYIGSGSTTIPAIGFTGDPDTGISNPVANQISVVLGGSEAHKMNSTSVIAANGAAATPAFCFADNTDLGMFRNSANAIGWAAAGSSRMTMNTTRLAPAFDGGFNLGTNTVRWGHLYVDDLTMTNEPTFESDIDAPGGFRREFSGHGVLAISTTQTLQVDGGSSTDALGWWTATRAGSLVEVSVHVSADRTAGTVQVFIQKSTDGGDSWSDVWGTSGTGAVTIDGTNTEFHTATQAKDTDTFVAGDMLRIRATTDGSWAPASATIIAKIAVEC